MTQRLNSKNLTGLFPAIPTPVHSDGQINVDATENLMSYLVDSGVDGVVPVGGTGEYGAIARSERVRMTELCVKHSAGKPVIPGILDPGFYDAQEVGKMLTDVGASALMLLTPYYTTPTQQGIKDYFLRFADQSELPIMIYEIPYRTRISISPDIIHDLSKHENIIGMKACNTDMYNFSKVIRGIDDNFAVLSGEDTLFPYQIAGGAVGAITVTATVLPKVWLKILRLCQQGDYEQAFDLHRSLIPFLDTVFSETNPGPLKSVMDLIGVDSPEVLTPLIKPSKEKQSYLKTQLEFLLKKESTYGA